MLPSSRSFFLQKPHSERTTWIARAWDSPSIGAAAIDKAGTIREVNMTFQSWSGETSMVGSPLVALVSEGQREVVLDLLHRAASSQNDHVNVGMFPDADGVPADVRLSIVERDPTSVLIEPYGGVGASGLAEVMKLNDRLTEMQRELRAKNQALEAALEEVKNSTLYIRKLEGILPICMTCKSVKNDSDDWMKLDKYLSREGGVSLSHGLCPSCAEAMQTEMGIKP